MRQFKNLKALTKSKLFYGGIINKKSPSDIESSFLIVLFFQMRIDGLFCLMMPKIFYRSDYYFIDHISCIFDTNTINSKTNQKIMVKGIKTFKFSWYSDTLSNESLELTFVLILIECRSTNRLEKINWSSISKMKRSHLWNEIDI